MATTRDRARLRGEEDVEAVNPLPKAEVVEAPQPPAPVEPEVLASDVFPRGAPLTVAFLHEEKLTHGMRKMSASAWKTEYDAWLKRPR